MDLQFSNVGELKASVESSLVNNGYFIKSTATLPIRSQVKLSFFLTGTTHKFEITGEVVFAGGGGIGLHYIETAERIKTRLNEFIKTVTGKTTPQQEAPKITITTPPIESPKKEASTHQEPGESSEESLREPDELSVAEKTIPPQEAPKTINVIKGKMRNVLKIDVKKNAGMEDRLGDFGELSFTKILINVFEGKTTGIGRFKTQEVEKVIYFRSGRPVFVESNPPLVDESIGQILVNKGKVKKEDLEKAVAYVEENGVRIGEAMMTLKMVSPTLLKDALTYQLKIKMYELFKWKEADFEMEIMTNLGQKFGTRPINVISIIYKGLKEKLKELYPADLEQFISPIYDRYLTKKEKLLFDLENLGLNSSEKRFWELMLNGRRRVREVFAGSTMNKPETFRFLYALLELDLLNINESATLDMPNIERELYTQARFMEKMDYFEALSVHWSVNKEKIERAYKFHTEEILDKKKIPNLTKESIDNIDRIAAVYKRAYEGLLNDSARREYRKQVLGESEAKVAAELAAKQAQLMEFRNDMKEARELIEVAMDLDPANSDYRNLHRKYGGRR